MHAAQSGRPAAERRAAAALAWTQQTEVDVDADAAALLLTAAATLWLRLQPQPERGGGGQEEGGRVGVHVDLRLLRPRQRGGRAALRGRTAGLSSVHAGARDLFYQRAAGAAQPGNLPRATRRPRASRRRRASAPENGLSHGSKGEAKGSLTTHFTKHTHPPTFGMHTELQKFAHGEHT